MYEQIVAQAIGDKPLRPRGRKYMRWINRGVWCVSRKCYRILEYLDKVKNARRKDIHRYLYDHGTSGFTWEAESLQRLLVFGAVRRINSRYEITDYGHNLLSSGRPYKAKVTTIGEVQLILKAW